MRNFTYFLFLATITFVSCDERKSVNKSLSESVERFKEQNEIVVTDYIPKAYLEHQVDTTLSNGFDVKIVTKTDMTKNVVLYQKKNNIKYSTNYRQFNFSISIKNNGQQIFKKTFGKNEVMESVSSLIHNKSKKLPDNFNKLAVLKSIQLNEELSIEKDSVYIDIAYAKPNDNHIDWHTLKIDKNGMSNFIQFVN